MTALVIAWCLGAALTFTVDAITSWDILRQNPAWACALALTMTAICCLFAWPGVLLLKALTA